MIDVEEKNAANTSTTTIWFQQANSRTLVLPAPCICRILGTTHFQAMALESHDLGSIPDGLVDDEGFLTQEMELSLSFV